MALTNAYLQTTKNLQSIINSVVSAKAPERFTNKFLEDLGFKSSNDRLYIGLFKALGLLDENSAPTSRYHQLLDQAETGKVLAIGIQEAYEDLFALRKDAYKLTIDEVKGKLKTLTQEQKSNNIIQLMSNNVDRGDGVLAGLRAVNHVGVRLRGCNSHCVPPDSQ